MAVEYEIRNAGGQTGTFTTAAIMNDRSVLMSPSVFQWLKEGRVYVANRGVLTTPVAFAGTTITSLRPDLAVRCPAGTVMIPLFVQIYWEATGGTIVEAIIRTASVDVGAGTSTAVTPINANTRYASRASAMTVAREYTADCAAVTDGNEVFRVGSPTDLDANNAGTLSHATWSPLTSGAFPVLVGGTNAGSLLVNTATATSSTGFVIAAWAEFTSAEFYGS